MLHREEEKEQRMAAFAQYVWGVELPERKMKIFCRSRTDRKCFDERRARDVLSFINIWCES